ncbi:MAG: FAD-dependent monooxygenase [Gammaproteobacteria bacterium]|nr:FAD-dependent monooxygenase [Gammaproteobacteria bacterium]
MMIETDIAVVGGGAVGMLSAILAAQAGLRVVVIEKQPVVAAAGPAATVATMPAEFDLRSFALTAAAMEVLSQAGCLALLPSSRLSPLEAMTVWDAGSRGCIHFDAMDIGAPALGVVLENATLMQALQARARTLPALTWLAGHAVTGLIQDRPLRVLLDDGEVCARLVIAADGRNSRIRELLDVEMPGADYAQHAVVANLRTAQPHQQRAWQRFLATGPVALLPLPAADCCAMVWSTTPQAAKDLIAMPDAQFCQTLGEATEFCLGEISEPTVRLGFPLLRANVQHYVQRGVAFVGDAAHIVHPLAGQGLNLGIMDAACLIETVLDARTDGRDIGARGVLRRYERKRKGENLLTSWTMDGFKHLFGNHRRWLGWLRGAGMMAFDGAGPLKRALIARTSGMEGDLPRFARRPRGTA